MNKTEIIEGLIKEVEEKLVCFKFSYQRYCNAEEAADKTGLIEVWLNVLQLYILQIADCLPKLKDNIYWSLLDDRMTWYNRIKNEYISILNSFLERRSVPSLVPQVKNIITLLKEGESGYRSCITDKKYYEELFNLEYELFVKENEDRIRNIYRQDREDYAKDNPDMNIKQINTQMIMNRRNKLFDDHSYGEEYHNLGRDITELTQHIIGKKEENYITINSFFSKLLALNIAEQIANEKVEQSVYHNIIFKDAIDYDQVFKKLNEFLIQKTIYNQCHWYLVYRVFLKKSWLTKKTQAIFRDQIQAIFGKTLKCTAEDFKKIPQSIKNADYEQWNQLVEVDPKAPAKIKDYYTIIMILHKEFIDSRYLKPGRRLGNEPKTKIR